MRSAEDQVVEDEVGIQDDEVYIENEEKAELNFYHTKYDVSQLDATLLAPQGGAVVRA